MNELLSRNKFGYIFGEQLILEYEFLKHCIDNKIEGLVLIDTFVKKNEIRLNTFERILASSDPTLRKQLIESRFIEKMCSDYICDPRELNVTFSKIDLEFLAFRKSMPFRMESISLVNTIFLYKHSATDIFSELIMFIRRYNVIKREVSLLKKMKANH